MNPSELARFEAKIIPEPNSGCWLWLGTVSEGYGHLFAGGRVQSAHRLAYEHWNGCIPDGECVCHRCDVRLCCNPAHLFAGTQKDNIDDMRNKGRAFWLTNPEEFRRVRVGRVLHGGKQAHGERHPRARLTASAAREIVRSPLSDTEAARQFGVHPATVWHVRSGTTWHRATGLPRRGKAGRP